LQIAFGGLLVRRRLLHIALRDRLRRVEVAQPRQILGVEIQHAGGRDQGRFGLQKIGAIDGEQRLAFADVITDFGKQRDDAALIRRKDLDRHVLVEVDAADGIFLDGEFALRDRLDLDYGELGIRQVDAVQGSGILRGRLRRALPRLRRFTRAQGPIGDGGDDKERGNDGRSRPIYRHAGSHRQVTSGRDVRAATWSWVLRRRLVPLITA